ncbi:hypothetical protein F5X96DRAFT_154597 [Biscogniauxia mediterranea]|nr:hypothetical protein F5X96DRAFT_154597 [Biscogniauxia mediterranea]
MNAIGKFQASLASATQETTVTLANANFDFSLIRYEAPAEYRELGLALAKNKKSEAENGQAHTTASRLGSLFKSILPETPNLIRAYGTRASEIAQSPIVNPRGTEEHGPFRDYVGVDGTSIWAAATSSSAAIAAHLLACMIACCWKHDEATAIWVEIVTERKRRLEEKWTQDEYFHLRDAVTSKLELDKDQLANWDASARAWLAAANDAPVTSSRQKAVRGLLNELDTSINSRQDVYSSVTEAWRTSLETLEKVVCGASYSIHDGAVILALLTWHLYPDIIVQGSAAREISQKDDLVNPGGIITIGLKNPMSGNSSETPGVHWSLSLAHLRYYGSNKPTTRSLTSLPSGNSRFTFDEFVFVFLGAVIGQWNQDERVSLESALEFINLVVTKFEEALSSMPESQSCNHKFVWSWISVIQSAMALHGPVPLMQQDTRKLLFLGLRNFKFITMDSEYATIVESPFRLFGLDTLEFVRALNDSEDQDEYINSAFKRFMEKGYRTARQRHTSQEYFLRVSMSEFQINTAVFYSTLNMEIPEHEANGNDVIRGIQPDGGYIIDILPGSLSIGPDNGPGTRRLVWSNPPTQIMKDMDLASITKEKDRRGEKGGFIFKEVARLHNDDIIFSSVRVPFVREHGIIRPRFRVVADIPQSYEETQQFLQKKPLNAVGLIQFMNKSPLFVLLRVLAAAADLYSELPGATIPPEIVETRTIWSIGQSFRWSYSHTCSDFKYDSNLYREEAFRLLSFFETGHNLRDMPVEMLSDSIPFTPYTTWSQILAISIEDTLYIAAEILGDLMTTTSKVYNLRRVRGNIGRPGITSIGWFSDQPMECRRADPMRWQVVNHNTFDGKPENYFGNTSLHLQLTGYATDINFGRHNRVANGAIVDAAVSAYDKGVWLSDFNLLDIFMAPRFDLVVPIDGCTGDVVGHLPEKELVTIENWEEFLSPHPSTPAVVKCHGNWQARLTALAMCTHLGYRPILFGRHGCWRCALKLLAREKAKSEAWPLALSDIGVNEFEDEEDESSSQIPETSSRGPGFSTTVFIL